uniref:calreticulin-like n=1 Tax=Urocitellus parryii TaxID=9999 RepID=UPI000E55ED66|nr:calreticulin-like [Urocitellus parryii]
MTTNGLTSLAYMAFSLRGAGPPRAGAGPGRSLRRLLSSSTLRAWSPTIGCSPHFTPTKAANGRRPSTETSSPWGVGSVQVEAAGSSAKQLARYLHLEAGRRDTGPLQNEGAAAAATALGDLHTGGTGAAPSLPARGVRRWGSTDEWKKRWVESKHRPDYGKFQLTAGKFYGDQEKDKGLQTSEDAKFYALSTRFKPFSNENETLVVQFSVKHEQGIDCGGGYVKLFPATLNQEDMHSESEYYIMFGPDICGFGNNKVQVILHYQGKYHENNKTIKCRINKDTHLYTLIIRPNATYEVKIDNQQVATGELEDDWQFLPPRKIKDPYARKPRKWDERLQIEDPEDKKPEDWEDFEYIPDPEAKKPDDWNEAMDGEWEGPLIPNLKYKGQWKPRIIDNPNYQGEWIHPEIDNPKYKPDPTICHYYNISVLGLDLWQVKSGSIFDNFLLTNDEEFAEEVGNKTWGIRKDIEKQWRELYEEMEKRKQEEEAKKRKEEEEEREDDIWGLEKEENEEDPEEEPGNSDRQVQEDNEERGLLGENEEVRVDQKDEL